MNAETTENAKHATKKKSKATNQEPTMLVFLLSSSCWFGHHLRFLLLKPEFIFFRIQKKIKKTKAFANIRSCVQFD